MTKIPRYEMNPTTGYAIPIDNGQWCKWSDVEKLLAVAEEAIFVVDGEGRLSDAKILRARKLRAKLEAIARAE